jgi:hypothetical protein
MQVVTVELEDREAKRPRHDIAELSRPNRAANEQAHLKRKKPQGRKRKHTKQEAKYKNWHAPFLWNQIVAAAKDPGVGFRMSAWQIMKVLKKKSPDVFASIAHSTIEEWIDRSGERPRWSDSALRMAELGNNQGHHNGGRRGVLVSC